MRKITIKGPNETVYEYHTKDGLTVFIWPNKFDNEVALNLGVKYGSIHTSFEVKNQIIKVPNGTAHFLEHIKFNESKDKTAHDYYFNHGSYVNAYTTYDHTLYEVISQNSVEEDLKHLIYFVYNPFFTEELIEKEKPIIIEESKSVLDNPYNISYEKLTNNLYIESNRKNLITGKEEDIKKINIDDINNVFNNYYHPRNMFLVICGNVNPNKIIDIIEEEMAKYSFKKYSNPKWLCNKEPNKVHKKLDEIKVNVAMPKLMMGIKIPLTNLKDFNKREVLAYSKMLLDMNFGPLSLFNEYLINQDLKDDITYYPSYEEDHLIITFEVSSKYPSKVLDLIIDKFKHLKVNEKDFNRKMKSYIANSILGYESGMEVAVTIIRDYIRFAKITSNYPQIIKKYNIKDMRKIRKHINCNIYSAIILLPR